MRKLLWLFLFSAAFAQEVKRPTTDADGGNNTKLGCLGVNQGSSAVPLGYDAAGQSTSSSLSATGSITKTNFKTRVFGGWQPQDNAYSALTLNINSLGTEVTSGSTGKICADYSIDGGVTWLSLFCGAGGYGQSTKSVALAADQVFSSVRVAVCVQGSAGGDTQGSTDTIKVFDIWTSGTFTPIDQSGAGSSSGNAHRGAVVVN